MTVMAAPPEMKDEELRDNADIVRYCHLNLEYLKNGDRVLDPTYGDGKWWTKLNTEVYGEFVKHDKYKLDGIDFTDLPHEDNYFDAVTFDPPYCAKGGRKTSGIQKMDAAYGQDTAPATPNELQTLINKGIWECTRVLKPKGFLLVKCMSYISSGLFWPGEYLTWEFATIARGLQTMDRFYHVNDGGPQPPGRRQLHARNNASVLFVFRKGK